ncbi:ATM (predicted) [Pycnogonum litorale]
MYKLIRLATQQNDKEVSIEACRCLGDIGPVDLSSVVLMSEQVIRHSKFHMFPDYQSYHMYTVLKSLNTLLVDADYMVKHAAGSVLKHILTISSVSVYLSSSEDEEIRDIYPYIKPFIIKNKSVQKPTFDIRNACDVIGNELLWMPNHDDHNRWITELVCTLIMSGAVNDEVLNLVEPVCRVNVEFCEEILSFVIWSIIQRDSQSIIDVLSAQISTFFRKRCECITSQDNQEKLATTIIMNKQSVRAMIGVVQYLRLQKTSSVQRKDKTTPWDDNFWLNVDYLDIAEAARFCSAYFTSLLYCEIWIEQYKQNIDEEFASISASQESQWTSTIENLKSDDAKRVQNLLNDAYSSIGDPDSIYGCRFLHKIDFSNRIRRYKQEKNWEKLIAAYDLELSFNPNASNYGGLLNSLQCHGFNHILEKYLNGLNAEDDLNGAQEFQQFQYECAWRNGTWDLPDLENDTEVPNYHKILHQCLCNLKEGDYDGALQNVECGRLSVVQVLTTESLAVTRKVYPELSKLQCLSILEEASNCCLATDIPKTQEMWNSWDKLSVNEFEFVEPILTMECIVIQTEMARNSNPIILSSFLQHRLQTFAKLARLTGHYQVAERCLSNLKQISADIYGMTMWSWKLEEAELMWARAETNLAVQLIKSLLNDLTKTNELEKHVSQFSPRVLTVYGKWLAETCSESPVIIFNNYLDKAALMLNKLTDEDKHPMLDTYLTLARYSDLQHQNITDYLKSPTYQSKRELINRSRHELLLLNGIEKLTQKEKEARRMHCKHIEMDEAEIKAMHNDRDGFLLKSIQNYIQCLCLGDDYILSVCRLISLWFQSASDVNVSSLIKENIDRIPSYKFLPLMYQLAARMSIGSSQGEMFQDILQELILKTTKDHPYHTLLIIFALANAPKDMEFDAECKIALSRNQHCHQPEAQDDRVLAAQEIIDKLSKDSHENLIGGLDQMCDAYIKLAYMNVANPKINPSIGIPIPRNQPILQLQNIPGIPVPTANVQVDKSAVYRDIPTILSIQRTYNLCGGVSLPKKIICSGSDGKSYIQLVKGKDDLRQDAVMQQFFSLVNNLLKQDDDMKRRKLNMRTYKVIPLSRRSGIVQWCDGTQPFASYLVESGKSIGAHRLYHPSDLTSNQCRKKLMVCAPSSNQVKLAQYNEVCSKFRPVFRHFFFENFRDPSVWFERRLSYTQSVATCSVVGYILGLGDRHVQNILIDKKTAEFIHIDLGIAFEQGKLLPTPETVPFRLTRDVVDGMGVSGVEGVFRRCAEKTMEVMHKSREVLLTIPQVLLYDPLYKWLISQEKVAKVQGLKFKTDTETVSSSNAKLGERRQLTTTTNTNAQDEPEINKIAERVLLRLKEKLQGVEKGTVMSVNGQINYLIQEAMDPNNLSRLYHGWQPYL